MKSEKGVTLMSLATYVVLMLIVIAILATVMTSFQSNIREINKEGTEFSEISKFNMYFLQEVKKQGNKIDSISNTKIKFSSGNTYTYENNEIYLQNQTDAASIILASNIIDCTFNKKIENGKNIVIVKIKTNKTGEITNEYVLIEEEQRSNYEDEDTYIYNQNNI